jgi:hypothetical protein
MFDDFGHLCRQSEEALALVSGLEYFDNIPLVDEQNWPIAVVSMPDLIGYLSNFFSRDIQSSPEPRIGSNVATAREKL